MSCIQTIQDYGLRSLGFGERLLPKTEKKAKKKKKG